QYYSRFIERGAIIVEWSPFCHLSNCDYFSSPTTTTLEDEPPGPLANTKKTTSPFKSFSNSYVSPVSKSTVSIVLSLLYWNLTSTVSSSDLLCTKPLISEYWYLFKIAANLLELLTSFNTIP